MNWQYLLTQGNKCFNQENWLNAEYYYRKAENMLDKQWQADTSNPETLMAWICSNHNLAAVHEKQGDHQISLQYLLVPHQRMLALSQNNALSDSVKLSAIQNLKVTLTPIILYKKKHPICQHCTVNLLAMPLNNQALFSALH